ncbi:MAG: fasciclin domain-containing protein, partial [Anaerolineae bacterium]|nr:fasciclin domain-containing protein [Anaerolineae bacterium]MDW8173021.1 fasciclin domain-containing protein [Anaerolineae bacterium]
TSEATVEATAEATPEATVEATAEATPEATVEVTPEATPEATVEATPEATPEATVEATPEATPEATVEVTAEATPEVTPEATVEVTAEATPEVTPEATVVAVPLPIEIKTIVEIASDDRNFTTLVAAVVAADLAETLSSGEFTVFAPTNEAFSAALASLGLTLDELVAQPELLRSVLTYHVIEGAVTAETVLTLDGQEVTTVNGEAIRISIEDGAVVLNDSVRVVTADIVASNGIIHVIDGVLLPPSLSAAEATAEPQPTATATPRPTMRPTSTPRPTATSTPRP